MRGAAVAVLGSAMLTALRTGRTSAQATEIAQDLGDGSAQNWLVHPDGRRMPAGCRYSVATGECVGPGPLTLSPAKLSWANNWGGESLWAELMDRTIAAFQQRYPQVTVEREAIGFAGSSVMAAITRIAAGVMADLSNVGQGGLQAYPDEHLNLMPYFRAQGLSLADYELLDFLRGERLLGLPVSLIPNPTWLANVNLFQRANVPWPRPDWTWDDALDVFRRIVTALSTPDRPVFATNWTVSGADTFWAFAAGAGADWWDKEQTTLFPQQAPALEAWTWLVETHTRYNLAVVPGTDSRLVDRTIGPTPFDSQRIVIAGVNLGWAGHCLRNKCQFQDDWLTLPVHPGTRKSAVVVGDAGDGVMAWVKTKYPEQAATFALFLGEDGFQVPWYRVRGGFPVRKALWADPDFRKGDKAGWPNLVNVLASGRTKDLAALSDVEPIIVSNLQAAAKGEIGTRDAFLKMISETKPWLEKWRPR